MAGTKPCARCGATVARGYFPPFRLAVRPFKERLGSRDVVKRAAVPPKLSAARRAAVSGQAELPLAG